MRFAWISGLVAGALLIGSAVHGFDLGGLTEKIKRSERRVNKEVKKAQEKVSGKVVPVKDQERWMVEQVFGKTMDASKLEFRFKSVLSIGSTRTTKNIIQFDKKHNVTDKKYRMSASFFILLVHEATHVWQFQNVGIRYIPDSLYHQGKGQVIHGNRNEAYKYKLQEAKPFNKYNAEQQAKMVEEYFALKVFLKNPKYCTNFSKLKKENFIRIVEKKIKQTVNPTFVPLNGLKIRKRLYTK